MDYQQQIEKIKAQIEDSSKSLDKLCTDLKKSDEQPIDLIHNKITKSLTSYLALGADKDNALLKMMLHSAMSVVGASGAGLTLINNDNNSLVFKSAVGDGAQEIIGYEIPIEGSLHGLAYVTGEVQSSTPINTNIEEIAKVQFKNALVAPLYINDEGIGTLSAVNKQNGEHFTQGDMKSYKYFSDLAAVIIKQNQREDVLKKLISDKSPASTPLEGIAFGEEDQQLFSIVKGLTEIAEHKAELLPLCKQFVALLNEATHATDTWL